MYNTAVYLSLSVRSQFVLEMEIWKEGESGWKKHVVNYDGVCGNRDEEGWSAGERC